MRRALKPTMAAMMGLGALALASAPITTAAADERTGKAGAPQLFHMGDGGGGGYAGGMHMKNRGMMGGGHGMGSAMMGHGQHMGPGHGMVPPTGHQGMMGHGMRVTPKQNLTTDDVRHFFEDRLARHGNERLKIGEVKQADDDSITADIVTTDNSLVRRFKVDRHTGRMQAVE